MGERPDRRGRTPRSDEIKVNGHSRRDDNVTNNQSPTVKTGRKTDPPAEKKALRPTSGVVISGREEGGIRNLPSDRTRARALKEKRADAEWNRGIVRVKVSPDRILMVLILTLLALGTVMVFSASYPYALHEKGDSLFYIKKQLFFAAAGIVAMIGLSFFPVEWFRRLSVPFYGLALVLLVLVLIIGTAEDEAQRWLGVPNTALSFQPSEVMKPALVMMLAWFMDKYRDDIIDRTDRKKYFLRGVIAPFAIVGLACVLVLLEKHLSGTLIIGALGVCVMFIGGAHLGYTALSGVLAGGVAITGFVLANPYALKRLLTFTNENADVLSDKWQTTQGLYAIGSGGLLGQGLGYSHQKYSYVSEAHNDFIFTIWCEEMGFVGALFLICLFLAFIWRGYVVAMHAPDTYSSLVAAGIVTQIGIQVMLNIGVVTDVLPNTGVTLPFFSYGGSALVILMAEMGVLLAISRHSYQRR